MSRAVTTHWMLAELDAEHEQVLVDFPKGENNTPEYRAINPMGKIPALVDGQVVITETAAICAYLADKFPDKGLAPAPNSTERGRYYRFLFFTGTTLEPMLTFNQLGARPKNYVQFQLAGELENLLSFISQHAPIITVPTRKFCASIAGQTAL